MINSRHEKLATLPDTHLRTMYIAARVNVQVILEILKSLFGSRIIAKLSRNLHCREFNFSNGIDDITLLDLPFLA